MTGLFERREFLRSPLTIRVALVAFGCVAFFFLGKHWSSEYPQQFVFFNSGTPSAFTQSPVVGLSPNADKKFNFSSLIDSADNHSLTVDLVPPPPPPPQRYGVVDANGTMTDDFDIGDSDPNVEENWGGGGGENQTYMDSWNTTGADGGGISVGKFPLCPEGMREYIPCLDNEEDIRKLESTDRGEKYERHCPGEGKGLNCLVPAPKDFKYPIPWPTSRDQVARPSLNLFQLMQHHSNRFDYDTLNVMPDGRSKP